MEAIRPLSSVILSADLTVGEALFLSSVIFTMPSPTVATHKVESFSSLMECTYFTLSPLAVTGNSLIRLS